MMKNNLKKIITPNPHINELKRPYHLKNTIPMVCEILVLKKWVLSPRDFL